MNAATMFRPKDESFILKSVHRKLKTAVSLNHENTYLIKATVKLFMELKRNYFISGLKYILRKENFKVFTFMLSETCFIRLWFSVVFIKLTLYIRKLST